MKRTLVLLALVVAACGPAEKKSTLPFAPAGPDAAPDPAKSGPYPVGVRTVTLSDPSRPDAQGNARSLVVEIWYPATDDARGKPGVDYDVRVELTEAQKAQVADIQIPLLHTSAVRDASPRKDDAPYPLVVFSHGHGGVRWQSTFYTVALASHGYVVVAPDHTGDTLADALDGHFDDILTDFSNRPGDVTFLLDTFTTLAANDPLAGMIDGTRIGVSGHSFGALTSLRVAAYDDRVKAIVPQAPYDAAVAFVGKPDDFKLSVPTMIEAAHDDQTLTWDPHVTDTWPRLSSPRGLLDITHGGHFTFSDLCAFDLASIADKVGFADLSNVINDGCGPNSPKSAQTQPLMNHFAIGFFNWQLRGSVGTRALLDQAHADAIARGISTFDELGSP